MPDISIIASPYTAPTRGELSTIGERDYYSFSFTAGRSYVIDLMGDATASPDLGAVRDTTLAVVDATGSPIGFDDDSGEGLNSRIDFTPGTSGTLYIQVAAYSDYYAGGYYLSITSSNAAPEITGSRATLPSVSTTASSYTITTAQLLQGYTDPDGDPLAVENVAFSNGVTPVETVVGGTRSWTFDPTAGGTVSVSYAVTDGQGNSTVGYNYFVVTEPAPNQLTMTPIEDNRTREDGGSARYLVSLNNTITSGSFQVRVETLDATEGMLLDPGTDTLVSSRTLLFDATHSSYEVVVQGVQDYENDGSASYNVRARADNDLLLPASSGANGSWISAIRDFNGGTTSTNYRTFTLFNDGDLTGNHAEVGEQRDRDIPVVWVGDEGRPREDVVWGNDGTDRLYGGYMIDQLHGGIGGDRLYGGYEDDELYGDEGPDMLFGEQDDDYLNAGEGNDRLDGGLGADRLIGGPGNDVYYVTLDDDGRVEDLIVEAASGGGTDTVYIPFQVDEYTIPVGVENVRMNAGFSETSVTGNTRNNGISGNAGDNRLDGGGGNDSLNGGPGEDSLLGGSGTDQLGGGNGRDVLTGGLGADRFALTGTRLSSMSGTSADVISDFTPVQDDIIILNRSIYTAVGSNLDTTEFVSSATGLAADPNDFVCYDETQGRLYYDSNGSGAGGRSLIATLVGQPDLAVGDFMVI